MQVISEIGKIPVYVIGCLILVVIQRLPIWFVHSELLDDIPLTFPISPDLTLPLNFYCFPKFPLHKHSF